jgi:hypothetical protein
MTRPDAPPGITHTGHTFSSLAKGLHPAVGLRTPGESVVINFAGPFIYDIDSHVKRVRESLWGTALSGGENFTGAQVPMIMLQRTEHFNSKRSTKESGVEPVPDEGWLPQDSALRNNVNKSAAAFVMDYLRHSGYASTLELTKDEMVRRKWLKSPEITPPDSKSAPDINASATITLDDFNSPETALVWLQQRLSQAYTLPVPLLLVSQLRTDDKLDLHQNKLAISNFIRLLRLGDEGSGSATYEDEAIVTGRALLKESEKGQGWSEGDKRDLGDAFALIGLPCSEWGGNGPGSNAWIAGIAAEVVDAIRRESYMLP